MQSPTRPHPRARRLTTPQLTTCNLLLSTALATGCGAESSGQQPPGSSSSPSEATTTEVTSSPGTTSTSATPPPPAPTPPAPGTQPPAPTPNVPPTGNPPPPAPNPPAAPTTDTSATSDATSSEPAGATTDEETETGTPPGNPSEGSAGCGATPPESGRFEITVDGEPREYILAVPEGYDSNKPYRLVFGWHPWGGSAQQVAGMGANGYYGLQGPSEGNAIFVAPEGLDFGGNGKGWGNENGKDLAFFDAMLERFEAELCIDRSRIFSTGFSFGGMMSWALGCGRGDVVRAIAPMAGNTTVSGCLDGDNPVAVMGFHGDDDTVVDISGGRVGRDKFVERNNCGEAAPSDSTYCDGVPGDRTPCECVTYQGCDEGYPVTWCEFNGPHTPAPNSGQIIWDFFAQF